MTAASSPGSTISQASGLTATTSIRRSISTCSKSRSAIARAGKSSKRRRGWTTIHRILGFQRRLVESGQFANPRAHIYYLPELYSAYVGRCYAAFRALPPATQHAIDPDDTFGFIRLRVLAYVQDHLITHEMNAFDAALALIALGHLDADADHSQRRSPASSRRAAKAAATVRSRPMNGTR